MTEWRARCTRNSKRSPGQWKNPKKRATTKQPAHGENLNLLVASTGFVIVAQLYYKDRYKCPRCQGDHGNSGSHVYNRGRLTNIQVRIAMLVKLRIFVKWTNLSMSHTVHTAGHTQQGVLLELLATRCFLHWAAENCSSFYSSTMFPPETFLLQRNAGGRGASGCGAGGLDASGWRFYHQPSFVITRQ